MWFVSRRRHDADTAALRAEADRLRSERDAARAERRAFRTAASTGAEQVIDVSIVNDCLTRDLTQSRRQRVIARKAAARILAAWAAERRRADRLQQRLDDAVGLTVGRIEDSQRWQPGYVERKGADA